MLAEVLQMLRSATRSTSRNNNSLSVSCRRQIHTDPGVRPVDNLLTQGTMMLIASCTSMFPGSISSRRMIVFIRVVLNGAQFTFRVNDSG